MIEYHLAGKQVILQLDPEFLPHLQFAGIEGSPLFARVHAQEGEGLWLETERFQLCPVGIPKLYRPDGEALCRAHIFVPFRAVLSIVTFPAEAVGISKAPGLHRIGFDLDGDGQPG